MRFKNRKRAVFFVAVIAGVVSLACSSATTPTPTGFQASTPVAPPPAAAAPTAEPAQPVAAVAPDPEALRKSGCPESVRVAPATMANLVSAPIASGSNNEPPRNKLVI